MRNLLHDRRGVAALIFALVLTAMMLLVGLGIDVGFAVSANARLSLAADAAVLTAVQAALNDLPTDSTNYLTVGQTAGAKRFTAQAGLVTNVATPVVSVALTRSGSLIEGTATWTATYNTIIGKGFGYPTVALAGNSSAKTTVGGPYADISILIDTSGSMSVASTTAGMTALGNAVEASPYFAQWGQGQPCALACHWSSTNQDFYGVARANNIQLRIDVIAAAVQQVFATILEQDTSSQYSVAVYTFNSGLTTIYPLSSNITAGETAAAGIQLPTVDPNNEPDTNFSGAMTALGSIIPASGDGSTAAKARQFLFILTDGVVDYTYSGTREQSTINPANCSALKAAGVTIAVLYTQYLPMPTNGWYNTYIAPLQTNPPTISTELEACASSSALYAEASDGPTIQADLNTMFATALSTPAHFTH